MTYHELPYAARQHSLGDASEAAFEEWATENDIPYTRWGLNRPPFQVAGLPIEVRCAPDYLCPDFFVECKGVGSDQLLKIKWMELGTLRFWHNIHEVRIFVNDSHKKRVTLVELDQIVAIANSKTAKQSRFHEGNAYVGIPCREIFP